MDIIKDITNQAKEILGNPFVDTLLTLIGLSYVSTATAVPLILLAGKNAFDKGKASSISGDEVTKAFVKLGTVGKNTPQYISITMLLSVLNQLLKAKETKTGGYIEHPLTGEHITVGSTELIQYNQNNQQISQYGGLYETITHPITGKKLNIYEPEALNLVNSYVHTIQSGGS